MVKVGKEVIFEPRETRDKVRSVTVVKSAASGLKSKAWASRTASM